MSPRLREEQFTCGKWTPGLRRSGRLAWLNDRRCDQHDNSLSVPIKSAAALRSQEPGSSSTHGPISVEGKRYATRLTWSQLKVSSWCNSRGVANANEGHILDRPSAVDVVPPPVL